MSACALFFMGQFALFTYLRPFVETAANVEGSELLLMGVAGVIGTTAIGALLKESLYRTLIIIPLLMAAIAVSPMAFGGWVAATALLIGLWGLSATSAPVAW